LSSQVSGARSMFPSPERKEEAVEYSIRADALRPVLRRHTLRYHIPTLTLSRYQAFGGPMPNLLLVSHSQARVLPRQSGPAAPDSRFVLPTARCQPARRHRAYWDAACTGANSCLPHPCGSLPSVPVLSLLVNATGPRPHLSLHSVAQFLASWAHSGCQVRD